MKTTQNYVVFGMDDNNDPTWVYVQGKNSAEAMRKADTKMLVHDPAIAVSEESIRRILEDFNQGRGKSKRPTKKPIGLGITKKQFKALCLDNSKLNRKIDKENTFRPLMKLKATYENRH